MLGTLNRASGTGQKLELIYINNDNQISHRVIKVLKVTDHMVKAYCYTKRQFRSFKLENILSVRILGQNRGA